MKGGVIGSKGKSHLEKEEKENNKMIKKGETNKDEKKKGKADSNKERIYEDDFEQETGQLKGNVIGDQNESHLEKEEKENNKMITKKEKQTKVNRKKKTKLTATRTK